MQDDAPRPGIPWTGPHSSVRLDPAAPAGPPYATAFSKVPGAHLNTVVVDIDTLPRLTATIAPKDLT